MSEKMSVLIEVFEFNWNELKWDLYTTNIAETDEQLLEMVKNFKSTYRRRFRIALSNVREGLKLEKHKCPYCESEVET